MKVSEFSQSSSVITLPFPSPATTISDIGSGITTHGASPEGTSSYLTFFEAQLEDLTKASGGIGTDLPGSTGIKRI